ncbi:MAG: N-acyl homoserine lactonase family protein [Geminicoccaceae bacterium]|nr:N-acyl homoserine lactonase family protein [Geminicoccaceae bacterium]
MTPHYEVYAIRYAGFAARTRRETFLGLDPHDAAPMPIDYFLWVIRDGQRTIVVDTGFDEAEGAARGRAITHHPRAALALLGVDAGQVEDVIVTHLHYDHAGTLDAFPRARFHLQEAEMAYATGYCMAHEALRHPYSVEHVVQMVRCVYSGRVRFVRGDAEIAPGVTVHLIGGHAKGVQAVRVETRSGPLVLASDTAHFYENLERHRPFIITHDVEATLRGYDRLRALAEGRLERVVPGHDPLVLERFTAPDARFAGTIVRLDR